MFKIKAVQRIMAATADEKQAVAFLQQMGFTKLKLKLSSEDRISFEYKDMDRDFLIKHLGKPVETGISDEYWKFGLNGFIVVKPRALTVVLKNAAKNSKELKPIVTKTPDTKPMPHVIVDPVKPIGEINYPAPDAPPKQDPIGHQPGSKVNDDSKVPHIEVPKDIMSWYAAARINPEDVGYRLRLMDKMWHYLNTKKFAGRLSLPKLGLMPNASGKSFKTRARWFPMQRILQVSPRLFNAHIAFFIEIFLHEMCHQAVTEVNKEYDNAEGGHGPSWQKWMIHVGLNPRRYDPNDNSTYNSPQERKAQEQREALYKQSLNKVQDLKLKKTFPLFEKPVTVIWNGDMYSGLLICPADKRQTKWAFVKDHGQFLDRHMLVDPNKLYEYAGKGQEQYNSPGWQACITNIKARYRRKGVW